MVTTLCFHCQGLRFNLWSGNYNLVSWRGQGHARTGLGTERCPGSALAHYYNRHQWQDPHGTAPGLIPLILLSLHPVTPYNCVHNPDPSMPFYWFFWTQGLLVSLLLKFSFLIAGQNHTNPQHLEIQATDRIQAEPRSTPAFSLLGCDYRQGPYPSVPQFAPP